MKTKFFLISFLLLFARGCDFYSTSLWFFDNPTGETNPLYKFLGFGWNGLLISNAVVVGLLIYAFYYFSFKYRMGQFADRPQKLTDFVSELYFNEKGKFYQVFYKSAKNKKVLLAHFGYVMVRVVILGSFLATIHNLCQYYQVGAYAYFREFVGRPLFVIYGLILLSTGFFSFRLWNKEYVMAKKQFDLAQRMTRLP